MNVRPRPSRSRTTRALAVTAALALGAGALSACSMTGDGRTNGRLDVVTSFYPMEYLAEQIGGRYVNVRNLTEPGQEPHDLELSARQTGHLQDAGLILYLKGLQPAVDDAVAQASARHKVDATGLTTLEKHGTEVGGHAAGEGSEEGEHGHEHDRGGAPDPHIWLDPVRYAEVARGVGRALEQADPGHAGAYRRSTDALVGRIGALGKRFADGLRNTGTRTFITTHAAFGYLAERYGLTQESISGLDPESEPSAHRIKDLHRMAKADGVTTVFYETLLSPETARTVASDTGLRTDVLDPLEGITGASRGEDYIQVMDANLKALQKALGAK